MALVNLILAPHNPASLASSKPYIVCGTPRRALPQRGPKAGLRPVPERGTLYPMRRIVDALVILAATATLACSAAHQGASREAVVNPHPTPARAGQDTPTPSATGPELLTQGIVALESGHPKRALALLERARSVQPVGAVRVAATYHAGIASDMLGRYPQALAYLREVSAGDPSLPLTRLAIVRSLRLTCHLERWSEGEELSTRFLDQVAAPRPFEATVVHAARALGFLNRGDVEAAQRQVEAGMSVVEQSGLDTPGQLPRDVAVLYYALGELTRLRASATRLSSDSAQFAASLERRCRLLLDAQAAYSNTMRAFDAHWSALAGYRLASLYSGLYEELMAVVPPAAANTPERVELYRAAMRLRYAILLRKALGTLDRTRSMLSRTGEETVNDSRFSEARSRLSDQLGKEQEAIDRLPYSRAELEEALGRLTAQGTRPSGE